MNLPALPHPRAVIADDERLMRDQLRTRLAQVWPNLQIVAEAKNGIEAIEAVRVEGVTEWRIFWYIVLPLMRPAIAALSVLIFTFIWNDFFWATVLTQGVDSQPITAGLSSLNGQWIAQWHLVSAGSILAALPPVAMFFLMQKHFIAGLTLGAVK